MYLGTDIARGRVYLTILGLEVEIGMVANKVKKGAIYVCNSIQYMLTEIP